MRLLTLALALSAASLLAACGGGAQLAGPAQRDAGATPAAGNQNRAGASNSDLGVVPSHGAANAGATPAASGSAAERALADTKKLDARIKEAAAEAKRPSAGAAEKKEAAAAYLERGNVYYSAGNPRLYKYALADFREALRYDAANKEAEEKIEQIEDIYRSMGRPVPNVNADQ